MRNKNNVLDKYSVSNVLFLKNSNILKYMFHRNIGIFFIKYPFHINIYLYRVNNVLYLQMTGTRKPYFSIKKKITYISTETEIIMFSFPIIMINGS